MFWDLMPRALMYKKKIVSRSLINFWILSFYNWLFYFWVFFRQFLIIVVFLHCESPLMLLTCVPNLLKIRHIYVFKVLLNLLRRIGGQKCDIVTSLCQSSQYRASNIVMRLRCKRNNSQNFESINADKEREKNKNKLFRHV